MQSRLKLIGLAAIFSAVSWSHVIAEDDPLVKLEARIAALEKLVPHETGPIYRFTLSLGRDDWGHFDSDKSTLTGIEVNKLPRGDYYMRTYRQRWRSDGPGGIGGEVIPAGGDWFWHDWRIVHVEANLARGEWNDVARQREIQEQYERNPYKVRIIGFYELDAPDMASPKVQYELVPITPPDENGKWPSP